MLTYIRHLDSSYRRIPMSHNWNSIIQTEKIIHVVRAETIKGIRKIIKWAEKSIWILFCSNLFNSLAIIDVDSLCPSGSDCRNLSFTRKVCLISAEEVLAVHENPIESARNWLFRLAITFFFRKKKIPRIESFFLQPFAISYAIGEIVQKMLPKIGFENISQEKTL